MNSYRVDKDEVLRYLGYMNGSEQADDAVCSEIDNVIKSCHESLTPRYTYTFFDIVEQGEEYVRLRNVRETLSGRDIAAHLSFGGCNETDNMKHSLKCVCMAATLGLQNEREINRLQISDMQLAVIYDAVSGALIESVADACENEIRELARGMGMRINSRFSPGYGDFPLEQQGLLVKLTDCERRLGMMLTDSMMMIPAKSITAVIGLHKNGGYHE